MRPHVKNVLIGLANFVYNSVVRELPRNCTLPLDSVSAINEYFDAIWVLTIGRNAERRQRVQRQLAGVNYTFFEGVDGRSLGQEDKRIDLSAAMAIAKRTVRVNELACTMSHVTMFQEIVSRGLNRVLIFEDDAVLLPGKAKWVPHILERLPPGWELVYFGYTDGELRGYFRELQERLGRARDPEEVVTRTVGRGLRTAAGHECTHAYAVSLAGATKLLESAYPVCHTADGWIEKNVLSGKITAYVSIPKVFIQESDLGSSIHMTGSSR